MYFIAFYIVVFILEIIFPHKKMRVLKKGFWLDIIWYLVLQGVLLQILCFKFIDSFYKQNWMHTLSGFSTLTQVLIVVVVIDFIDYWLHRLAHSWLPLWRPHEVHHSSLDMNWLSGSRMHFVEVFIARLIFGALLCFSGISEQALYYITFADVFFGTMNHCNIYINYGPMHYIFNSHRMHHVHHLNKKEYQFNNFANKFALWDWLFGTAYLPDKEEFKDTPYGIGYEFPQSWGRQMIHIFRKKGHSDI